MTLSTIASPHHEAGAAHDQLVGLWVSGWPCGQHHFEWCAQCNPRSKPDTPKAPAARRRKPKAGEPVERPTNRTGFTPAVTPGRWLVVTHPKGLPIPQGEVTATLQFTGRVISVHDFGRTALVWCENAGYAKAATRRLRGVGLVAVLRASRASARIVLERTLVDRRAS